MGDSSHGLQGTQGQVPGADRMCKAVYSQSLLAGDVNEGLPER